MNTNTLPKGLWIAVVTLLLMTNSFAQFKAKPGSGAAVTSPNLPVDPNVKMGKLPNGLTYYIRKNVEPKNRAELRLVVNAGSILENDKQVGLAHFVEHMAFNGTKNFKKQELVNFLEKAGVNFGADLNAYTSFDETVYMLQVPTDSPGVYSKALQILEDWAHNVSFDNEEIDKERGVIIEEWRLGRGADARMRDKAFPVVLAGSQYAKRLPIGTKENLETFKYDVLKQFYKDWYRPDLQAVIVVGDVDVNETEKMIKSRFARIPVAKGAKPRTKFGVPAQLDTKTIILTDKEQPYTLAQIYYKQPAIKEAKTEVEYRSGIVRSLFNTMMSARLSELSQKADPPFSFGGSSYSSLLGDKDAFSLFAVAKNGKGLSPAIQALLTENERVKKFGFTGGELDRAKKSLFSNIENAYNERTKTPSASYTDEYVRNFLKGEAMPGIDNEYGLYKKYLDGIQLTEVNDLIARWIKETDRAVVVMAPEKEKDNLPKEQDVLALLNSPAPKDLQPYEDKVTDEPIFTAKPKAGSITGEKTIAEIGVTELTLSNGAKVVLKPTDFKNDEVRIVASSSGGVSLYPDNDVINGLSGPQFVIMGGVGKFDAVSLQKKLAGKKTFVTPYISYYSEGLSCSTTPRELETAMQLIHLYVTAPRKDTSAYASLKKRAAIFLNNRGSDPNALFQDSVGYIMANYSPRRKPTNAEILDNWNLDRGLDIYKERFSDMGDFTFVVIGNFKVAEIKPLLEQYIASLPATGRKENWRDDGVRYPVGVVEKTILKGTEAKSAVRLNFTGTAVYSAIEETKLDQLCEALSIKLREKLREEASGVYGVGVSGNLTRRPREQYEISIGFGCAPENVEKLLKITMDELKSYQQNGALQVDLDKVIAENTRGLETQVKQNDYWLRSLQDKYSNNENPLLILEEPKMVKQITIEDTKRLANQYLNFNNMMKFILMPEK
jgi:zinc protease